jgi:hypothetical protein
MGKPWVSQDANVAQISYEAQRSQEIGIRQKAISKRS